ncbi:hypothetical protein B0T22DRAFT_512422 [Podospora appendiculata]|uniref:Uncharacterized protein n=1 Tax=Podospora appendiculata TaxID=314037 RepID=A0AAE0X9Y9_9PEZI|nr:hypothetical protein B0T22DRAFT_512422 [Podospora appendiculata]
MVGSKDLPPSIAPFFPNIFLRNQFRTNGLGLEAASRLLSHRLSHLNLAVRSLAKGHEVAHKLQTHHPHALIEVWQLDMASYPSIQAFARRVETDLPRLDLVLLNAGLRSTEFRNVSDTGHEEVIQFNYLPYLSIALLALPSLKAKSPLGTPRRLTTLNAALALTAKLATHGQRPLLPSFDSSDLLDMSEEYCTSKLFGHMFLWKLADCATELARGLGWGVWIGYILSSAVAARSLEFGVSTLVDAVFVLSYEIHPFNSIHYTAEGRDAIDALWEETLDEFAFANVQGILESTK